MKSLRITKYTKLFETDEIGIEIFEDKIIYGSPLQLAQALNDSINKGKELDQIWFVAVCKNIADSERLLMNYQRENEDGLKYNISCICETIEPLHEVDLLLDRP